MSSDLTLDELKQTQRALDYFLANFDLTRSEKRAANRAYDKVDNLIDSENIWYAVRHATTPDEATQAAMDWQDWASNQSMSYSDLSIWENAFRELGEKFNLIDEFEENGII